MSRASQGFIRSHAVQSNLIAAAILAARKLAQYDGGRRVPATISAIADAIRRAEEIMSQIDRALVVKLEGV